LPSLKSLSSLFAFSTSAQVYDKARLSERVTVYLLFKSLRCTDFCMQDILYNKLLSECDRRGGGGSSFGHDT
jgi:hypothetical protein